MSKFKIGDRVIVVSGTSRSGANYIGRVGKIHYQAEDESRCIAESWRWVMFDDGQTGGKCAIYERELNLIESNMTLLESFKGLFTNEPQKSFKKAGVTNDAGDLTEEGVKVFRAWLFQKYADEFKKEVVDQILAEQDKK